MTITKGMMSSNTDEWATPKLFFEELNKEFNFTLDPCATDENHKCKKYYTKKDDGLSKSWGGVVFVNPPYGREIYKWIEKAYNENLKGATIVLLLPARTDTKWFHNFIYKKHEIRFLKGRLKFNDGKQAAPFPSMVVVMKKGEKMNNLIEIDKLKLELKETQKMFLEILYKLDQIKIKLTSNEKVSKKDIIEIIDGEIK